MKQGLLSDIVGQTPLIRIHSLSRSTGCEIYGKAEFLNPGGSVKDRTAFALIADAQARGALKPGSIIYEGTAGNTGIGLATYAALNGYQTCLVLPDNQSQEKYQTLEALGARLLKVKPVPFADPSHFYHTARRMAEADPKGFWADQFENTANFRFHYQTTGAEIWEQTEGRVTQFCAAVGTGGTLAGVSRHLKEKNDQVRVTLADPTGSGMFQYLRTGEIKSEGSSVTEGIGIMRLTANFKEARIDEALRVSDQEMINMLYHLARHEGLLVGTSAALNVHAAWKIAQAHAGSGHVIVTILCDSALRYQSRIFNPEWLAQKGLKPEALKL